MADKQKKKKWFNRLKVKYRLLIMNEDTYEEKLSFRLSRLNVFVTVTTTAIVLIVLTIFIIAFTPLREYIPGYMDPTIPSKVYNLQLKADSLEANLKHKDQYLGIMRNIIEGNIDTAQVITETAKIMKYDTITLRKSTEDSVLRAEYERNAMYNLYSNTEIEFPNKYISPKNYSFFPPVKGIITNRFNLESGHYAVDIVAENNAAISAVMDGTIIMADWTIQTGYVIGIQHQGNFVSFYKHNSILLKKQGSHVKAGEPIAIIGDSGELTTGPHLHFELWHNGTPVNPEQYITF